MPFRLPLHRWRRFAQRSQRDEDAAREIQSYLEIETDENLARGLPPEAARAAARRKLGNATHVREEISLMNSVGLVAAVLASVGLSGLMSYSVARRRQEIGLRLAMGAPRRAVLRLVLGDATRLVVVGVLVGTALAAIAARSSESLLYGLRPWDAATFRSAAALLLIVGVAAASLPARRAMAIDPVVALRDE